MNHQLFSEDSFDGLWKRLVMFAKQHYSDLDPEDLAGTAIQRVLEAKSQVESSRLFGFLLTTLKRLAYDKLRTRLPMTSLQSEPIQEASCSQRNLSVEVKIEVVIGKLTPKQRAVIELMVHGYRTKEIAETLGVTASAVRARFCAARKVLIRTSQE